MSFLTKLRQRFTAFMIGRNGADQLGLATLIAALVLNTLDNFLFTGILSLLGLALYALTIFRMFSRDVVKRRAENLRFMTFYGKARKQVMRYWTRLKNIRQYKYFSCPNCKASIRMKRGAGEKQITCPGCHHTFTQKS